MRILLLEDDGQKADRIISVLYDVPSKDISITTATNVAAARECLDGNIFDLLVLDVRVPFRDGEEADDDGGLHLLKELLEDRQHRRPRYVVGVSGIETLYTRAHGVFLSHGWALLKYSPTAPEWADSLKYFVRHIASLENLNSEEDSVDVAIVTALEDPEFKAVKLVFPELRGPRPCDSKTLIWEGSINGQTGSLRVVAGCSWQMGLTSGSLFSARLLTKFRPKILAMSGICAGYPDTTKLGDVIAATQSWEWQGGKIVSTADGPDLHPAPEPFRGTQELITDLRRLSATDEIRSITSQFFPQDSNEKWTLHFGPMVSGLSVVASSQTMQDVRAQHRKIIGLDMEAYSVYAAAHYCASDAAAIVVKGVCDFGDSAKNSDYQFLAAMRGAIVLRMLLIDRLT